MNGCQYMRPVFTLPASENVTQRRWDLAMLTKEEFMAKYNVTESEYARYAEQ